MSDPGRDKRFAPACERNQGYILEVLQRLFTGPGTVLEVGSGTGQHAAYLAAHLPHLNWQPSDLQENLASIEAYRREAGLANLKAPAVLDLSAAPPPARTLQYVVSINTLHIVAWPLVENLFRLAAGSLAPGGLLYYYGPLRYAQRELEPSNAQFDRMLRARDPASGIRRFEDLDRLAAENGFTHAGDQAMPANNCSLWWRAGGPEPERRDSGPPP